MSMKIVTPQQMNATLAVTDSMSIHREAVVVPLGPEGQGNVRVASNKLEVTVPDEGDFDIWARRASRSDRETRSHPCETNRRVVGPLLRSAFLPVILVCSAVPTAALAGQMPETGEGLYRIGCAQCHGADGRGVDLDTVGFDVPPTRFLRLQLRVAGA